MDCNYTIEFIKGELVSISPLLFKGCKTTIQKRLDRCLGILGILTLEHPDKIEEIDFLKDHTWSMIEKLSRRII